MTDAWTLLLGDDLHYGVFENDAQDLRTATHRLTELMVEAAQIDSGCRVLDVGCGTGSTACDLAADHGADVVGISTSEVGLAAARERARARAVEDRVSFANRDGMDNGFEAGSFDRVWVLESSHLMRHRDRLLTECRRVLRPGGRLALCDIVLRRALPFADVQRLRVALTLLRDVFGAARMESAERYVELATTAGLDIDVQMDLTDATRPTFARWRDNADRFRSEATALLGESGLDAFVRATAVLENFWDEGILGYALLAGRLS